MSRARIELPISIFHTEAKAYLDGCMKDKPLGTTFHISIKQPLQSPFSKQEVEGQIRACYGKDNKSLEFTPDSPASAGKGTYQWDLKPIGSPIRKTSQRLLERFFHEGDLLVLGEVPREVHHWLTQYKEDNRNLIEYLKLSLR